MWKPISKKPKKDGQYLVIYTTKYGKRLCSVGNYKEEGWGSNKYTMMAITHWTELPRFPK